MNKTELQQSEWSEWLKIIRSYSQPSLFKSWWQIINSVVPYLALWVLMLYSLQVSYWITLLLAIPTAGFLVRIFIIFHDCGHGSFFKSQQLQRVVGILMGLLVFTPYHKWHFEHRRHHQTVGNLDKRGMGDVMTITVDEYKQRSRFQQFYYRVYRHPITIFLIAPFFLFTIAQHIPKKVHPKKVKVYTYITTSVLAILVTLLIMGIGLAPFLMIQIPIFFVATGAGVWLFYIQHQYEGVVWERDDQWNFKEIALNGSSYVKFPKILQWFSGNIGFHHIHHLGPKIPNYNLELCMNENAMFQKDPILFLPSLRTAHLRLWDEQKKELLTFKQALR